LNPTETVLLAFALALALVGVGYWMGRNLPPFRPMRERRFNSTLPTHPKPESTVRMQGSSLDLDSGARLKRDIDARLHAMRRARETAEPWQPPPVDRVDVRTSESIYAAWFADTTVEPNAPRRAH
jgi:hypothetical protein